MEKMIVTESSRSFEKNRFFKGLRKEVMASIKEQNLSVKEPTKMMTYALSLFGLWAVTYGMFLYFGSQSPLAAILLSVPWAIVMLAIQMSVMHDASHGASSERPWVNHMLTASISFLGGSALLWIKQHCQAHHNFTNVHKMDHDVDTNGLLRLHSSQPLEPHHKYQHIYAWLLYPLFILNWVWWGDFRDIVRDTYSLTEKERFYAIVEIALVKIWHTFLFIALPAYFFQSWWLAAVCYLISFVILGFFMVVIFQLAHISNVQCLPEGKKDLGDDWAIRQLLTTVNFATDNYFLTRMIGGLNYQIEHHIFPAMSNFNYPKIRGVVEAYCEKNKVPYYTYPTVMSAVWAHQEHLKVLGTQQEL